MSQQTTIQMESQQFRSMNPVAVTGFLSHYFWRYSGMTRAKFHEADSSCSSDGKTLVETEIVHEKTKIGMLSTYSEVLGHLLDTYKTIEAMAEADSNVLQFPQPPNSTPLQFAANLCMKNVQALQANYE